MTLLETQQDLRNYRRLLSTRTTTTTTNQWVEDNEIGNLPRDPRQWSRDDVAKWLRIVTEKHNLPEIPPTRFLMNGKALCLMSLTMFLNRVPLGGKLLYKDFQLRLCSVLYDGFNH